VTKNRKLLKKDNRKIAKRRTAKRNEKPRQSGPDDIC
jgi:hypothetical protein